MSACCRHYPGRTERPNRSLLIPRRRPSPNFGWVGSCIIVFEACSAFTRVTTYRLAKSPYATLYTGGSGGFVTCAAAPIATGWSDPVPRRVFCSPAVDQHLFTAHRKNVDYAQSPSRSAIARLLQLSRRKRATGELASGF